MSAFWDTMNAGHARRGAGSQSQARGEFERALSLAANDDERSEAQIHLGHIYKDLLNHARAREEYGKVASIPMAHVDHVQDAQTYLGQLKP